MTEASTSTSTAQNPNEVDVLNNELKDYFRSTRESYSLKDFAQAKKSFVLNVKFNNFSRTLLGRFRAIAKEEGKEFVKEEPDLETLKGKRKDNFSSVKSSLKRQREDSVTIHDWTLSKSNNSKKFNNVHIANDFYSYQLQALESMQNKKFNIEKDITELMAMSGILYLPEKTKDTSIITNYISSETLTVLRESIKSQYTRGINSTFPADIKDRIKKLLEAFIVDQDIMKATKALNKINDEIDNLKVFHIIQYIVYLLTEVVEEDEDEMDIDESQLEGSFVHPLIKYLTKLKVGIKPYGSNLVPKETKDQYAGNWRPDYSVEEYMELLDDDSEKEDSHEDNSTEDESKNDDSEEDNNEEDEEIKQDDEKTNDGEVKTTTLYGEIKPPKAKPGKVEKDKYKLGVFTKIALDKKNNKTSMSFMAAGKKVTLYCHNQFDDLITILTEIEIIILPLKLNLIDSIVDSLDSMLLVASIYENHRLAKNMTPFIAAPLLPVGAYKHLAGETSTPPSKKVCLGNLPTPTPSASTSAPSSSSSSSSSSSNPSS